MRKFIYTSALTLFTPVSVFAQSGGTDIFHILNLTKSTLNYLIIIFITLALVFFIYNVTKNVIGGDAEERANAKNTIIYGVIGIFVIVAIWGIVNFVGRTLGISNPVPVGDPKNFNSEYSPEVSQ